MQSARPRATFRSRRSTCAGRRARSSSVKVRAQLSQLGVGAIERAFLSVFGHMKGHVCQRGRRNRQTQVMVYRMGISMEPVCLHGRIGMFLSEDGYILSRVRRGPTSLCPHGPGEPSGALGRPRGGPPWPSGGWTDPRARGRISRCGKGVNLWMQHRFLTPFPHTSYRIRKVVRRPTLGSARSAGRVPLAAMARAAHRSLV